MAEERPKPPAAGAPTPAGGDPSMEDILASIRRILNEDEPGAAPATGSPGPDPAGDAEPLQLTDEMLIGGGPPPAPEPAAPDAAPPEPPPRAVAIAPPPAPPPAPPSSQTANPAPPEAAAPPVSDMLLAPAAAAAASAAVGHLLRTVAAERGSAVSRGGPTIEDVVREELRPLLKDWLDQHLPALVERLVRAEIERVVGRALS
jgi:uncharacterized protein